MRAFKRRAALPALAGAILVAAPAGAQTDAGFRFDPDRVPVGEVFVYVKSNLDGSNAGRIAVRVAAEDRLEAFKWHPGSGEATLVVATMDWSRFSVRRFESWRVAAGGERRLQATLEVVEGTDDLRIEVGGQQQTVTIENWPWHSYDFDFASLGLVLPHRVDPRAPLTIGIADVVYDSEEPRFADKGPVEVTWSGDEEHAGVRAARYRIDGPGLEGRGGDIWVRPEGMLAGFAIDLPDEPGYDSGRLVLEAIERLDEGGWLAFMRDRLDGADRTPDQTS